MYWPRTFDAFQLKYMVYGLVSGSHNETSDRGLLWCSLSRPLRIVTRNAMNTAAKYLKGWKSGERNGKLWRDRVSTKRPRCNWNDISVRDYNTKCTNPQCLYEIQGFWPSIDSDHVSHRNGRSCFSYSVPFVQTVPESKKLHSPSICYNRKTNDYQKRKIQIQLKKYRFNIIECKSETRVHHYFFTGSCSSSAKQMEKTIWCRLDLEIICRYSL